MDKQAGNKLQALLKWLKAPQRLNHLADRTVATRLAADPRKLVSAGKDILLRNGTKATPFPTKTMYNVERLREQADRLRKLRSKAMIGIGGTAAAGGVGAYALSGKEAPAAAPGLLSSAKDWAGANPLMAAGIGAGGLGLAGAGLAAGSGGKPKKKRKPVKRASLADAVQTSVQPDALGRWLRHRAAVTAK